ncbi:putative MPP superfamily phosphohydrolase [Paenibacillus baekrokdamisoli]|uniref:metallophosphoesterase n=1 Tax=Paenibacillus baekrokdamisoli TaxID=1712516 RepID=UPI000F7B3ACC|nr:metallophosphoesterase [Paenibacillus baekrokdamisoli]MBB3069617.1 putative MPP superfamily phosphohydrolase [Paenibacillus baekrokdamisoli]
MFDFILGLGVIAVGILGYMVWESYRYNFDQQSVVLERLPASFDQTHILFISDIHRRSISNEIIAQCKAAGKTDLVLIGGDLREKGVAIARSRDNIRKLMTIAPVYMVYGNHDYDENIRPLEVMLQEERVGLLINQAVVLEQKDGSRIRLVGVDDPRTKRDNLKLAISEPADGNELFTILLAHDPVIALRRDEIKSIDLILCGHTHGGQVCLPFIGPISRGPLEKVYWRGWFDLGTKLTTEAWSPRLFVSCGFGTSKLSIRLLAPAQFHRITLRSSAVKAQHR